MRKRASLIAGIAALLGVVASFGAAPAQAQAWPTRTIRVVIPLSAGSAADVIPRIVFEQVSSRLGQPIVIENRPGASGTIGARAVANAEPDGYTFLAHSSAHIISPSTIANLPYDPIKDFVAVAPLGSLPNVLVISPSKNIHTVQELVALGKKRPITFGSIGVGSPIYLTMERFRMSTGIKVQPIPFKGAPEVLTEVVAGRVDVYYSPLLAALPFIRSGKLVPLTVSSGKRASTLPNVPTSLEAGYPNSDYNFWIGVFAPAKTPAKTVEKLNAEITKALDVPAVQQKLGKLGVEPMKMSVAEFGAFVREELKTNAELTKAAGITPR